MSELNLPPAPAPARPSPEGHAVKHSRYKLRDKQQSVSDLTQVASWLDAR